MRALAGNTQVYDSFLRTLWLQQLLLRVQAIPQAQPTLPLDLLAEIPHRVIEVSLPPLSPAVAAPLGITELAYRIDDIAQRLCSIQWRLDQHPPTPPC